MSSNHYKQLVSELARSEVESLVQKLLKAFSESADNSVFPGDWLVMQLVLSDVVLDASKEISDILVQDFLNGKQFQLSLWKSLLRMCQMYASQASLQVCGRRVNDGLAHGQTLITALVRWRTLPTPSE